MNIDDTLSENNKKAYFAELWTRQSKILSDATKDKFARAYLTHIIGCDDKSLDAFVAGDQKAEENIAQITVRQNDIASFWSDVAEETPTDYGAHDIYWLIENTTPFSTFTFLIVMQIGGLAKPDKTSTLIERIVTNQIAYWPLFLR